MAQIDGTANNDSLTQNDGEDDVIDGMGGVDTIDFTGHGEAVTVNLGNRAAQIFSSLSGADTLVSIEAVIGTDFADLLISSNAGSLLSGKMGDDILVGRAGNDILNGGEGADILLGRAGTDQLNGGNGDDLLRPGLFEDGPFAEVNVVDGGNGMDTLDLTRDLSASAQNGVSINMITGTVDSIFGLGTYVSFTSIERVFATSGSDAITGNAGNNTLLGMDGNDAIVGRGGDDYVSGGKGADHVGGGAGNDLVFGDDGDDLLSDAQGTNTLNGGNGDDTLDLSFYNNDTLISLRSRVAFDKAQNDFRNTLVSVEGAVAGAGNDTLIGGTGDDFMVGGGGNDYLEGNQGDDYLEGGDGNDFFRSITGSGGFENNNIYGGDGVDTLDYRNYNDGSSFGVRIEVGFGNATDLTNSGNFFDFFSGIEQFFGSEAGDLIDGSTFAFGPILVAKANDGDKAQNGPIMAPRVPPAIELLLKGRGGDDTLIGGDLDDTLLGDEGDDVLEGGLGNDVLIGGTGSDTLRGEDGDDFLRPNNGVGMNELVEGGDGTDTLDLAGFSNGGAGAIVDTNGGAGTVSTGAMAVSLNFTGIEIISGSEFNDVMTNSGADTTTLVGQGGDDTLAGSADAADILLGGDGDDDIVGASHAMDVGNQIDGGEGHDLVDLSGYTDAGDVGVQIKFTDTGTGDVRSRDDLTTVLDGFTRIEGADGTNYDDVILDNTGTGQALEIHGHDGDDHIVTGAGDDLIRGGRGSDVILSGGGSDDVNGGRGDDFIRPGLDAMSMAVLNGGNGTDTLDLGDWGEATGVYISFTGATQEGNVFKDVGETMSVATINNFEYFNLTDQGDRFSGDGPLVGVYVDGNGGDDLLMGSLMTDALLGGDGGDTIFGNNGDDIIFGNDGADRIYGGDGADVIDAGAGDDQIYVLNTGNDKITTGTGNDTIDIRVSDVITITDFTAGVGVGDVIDFSTIAPVAVNEISENGGLDTRLQAVDGAATVLADVYLSGVAFGTVAMDDYVIV